MSEITVNGVRIPRYEMNVDLFLCKNTLILGGSGSGKSVFTRHILHTIAQTNKVPVGFLFNGGESEDLNPFFISELIRDSIEDEFVTKLSGWQQERVQIYRASSDLKNLQHYFDTHVRNPKTKATLESMNAEYDKIMRNPSVKAADRETLTTHFNDIKSSILRLAVASAPIDTKQLNDTDFAVYMGAQLNPNVLVVFEDTGADLASLSKASKAFLAFLYSKGRHQKYTTIMLLQNDTQMSKQNRSNAHVIFWADQGTMQTSTAPGRGLFPKSIAKQAQQIADSNFFVRTPGAEYRVLGYDAKKMCFFYVVSERRESLKIASPAVRELAERVASLETRKTSESNSLLRR